MDAEVLLEHVEQLAAAAARSGEPEALPYARAYAAGVLDSVRVLGLVETAELETWRERLRASLGAGFQRRSRFTISKDEPDARPADPALLAYISCRDLPLVHLAFHYDTAADEAAIASAAAAEHPDQHERVARASRLGFAHRGRPGVPIPEL